MRFGRKSCAGDFFLDFARQGFQTFVHTPILRGSDRRILIPSLPNPMSYRSFPTATESYSSRVPVSNGVTIGGTDYWFHVPSCIMYSTDNDLAQSDIGGVRHYRDT